ncbi:MAG: T9SS type A sorting domain-containing protein [Phaeodactylibacter sp.]|nr:T9SS type A sorting domain-containing protein [Phaeodactylibacter sp.]
MKKHLTLVATLLLASSIILPGQDTFARTYGLPPTYEAIEDIAEANGRYYGLGSKYAGDAGHLDMYLVVLGQNGELLGEFTYGTGDNRADQGHKIIALPDGLLLLGQVTDYNTLQSDLLAVKAGFGGQQEWARIYGDNGLEETFGDAARNEDGRILLIGGQGYAPRNLYLLEINASGDILSELARPAELYQDNQLVIPRSNGGWYIGYGQTSGQYIARLDGGLQEEWQVETNSLPPYYPTAAVSALLELNNDNLLAAHSDYFGYLIFVLAPDGSLVQSNATTIADLPNHIPNNAIQLENGNVLLGFRPEQNPFIEPSYLMEITAGGEELARHSLDGAIDVLNKLLPLESGFLLAGTTLENLGGFDAKAATLSDALEVQWTSVAGETGRLGEENGYSLMEGEGGTFYVLGSEFLNSDSSSITLTKIDADGNLLWQTSFGSGPSVRAYSLTPTSDGHVAVFGYQSPGGNFMEMAVFKISNTGDVMWETSYYPQSELQGFKGTILAMPDGGFIAGCHTFNSETVLMRLSADGAIEWAQKDRAVLPGVDNWTRMLPCYELTFSNDGNILIVGGVFISSSEKSGIVTQKRSAADGSSIWVNLMRRPFTTRGYSLATHQDGSVYGLGWQVENLFHNRVFYKLSGAGDSLWLKTEPPGEISYPANYSLSRAPGQQFLAVSAIQEAQPENSIVSSQFKGLASLINDAGEEIWRREFSPVYFAQFLDGIATTDGGIALVGEAHNGQPSDIYFVKLGPDGTPTAEAPLKPGLQLRLFPNPAAEVLQLNLRGSARGMVQAMLSDAKGQPLKAWQFEKPGEKSVESIDVRQLPAGSYFLSLAIDGVRYGKQWVKIEE